MEIERENRVEDFTKLYILGRDLSETNLNGRRVLFAFRDYGAARAILPVLSRFMNSENLFVGVVCDGIGRKLLESQDIFLREFEDRSNSILFQLLDFNPEVVVAGVSTNASLEVCLAATFRERCGSKVIWLSDLDGNTLSYLQNQKWTLSNVLPDYLLVPSKEAKIIESKSAPLGFNKDSIISIGPGQPAFDRLAQIDVSTRRQQTRNLLAINNECVVISFMLPDLNLKPDITLGFISDTLHLHDTRDIKLIVRERPSQSIVKGFEDKKLLSIKSMVIDTNKISDSIDVICASDLVISSGSTSGVEAVYLGIQSVYVYPDREVDIVDPNFPMVADGTIPVVVGQDEWWKFFQIYICKYRIGGLEKISSNWKLDGKSTERVVKFIYHILENLENNC